jgi:hypothetical protein
LSENQTQDKGFLQEREPKNLKEDRVEVPLLLKRSRQKPKQMKKGWYITPEKQRERP